MGLFSELRECPEGSAPAVRIGEPGGINARSPIPMWGQPISVQGRARLTLTPGQATACPRRRTHNAHGLNEPSTRRIAVHRAELLMAVSADAVFHSGFITRILSRARSFSLSQLALFELRGADVA
jgi:hypothetical protein